MDLYSNILGPSTAPYRGHTLNEVEVEVEVDVIVGNVDRKSERNGCRGCNIEEKRKRETENE